MALKGPKLPANDARNIVASSSTVVPVPLQTPECALFAAHYVSLQRETGKIVPPRKSFNPNEARRFLSHMSILELREPKIALVRLIGTAIANRTHIDNTGRNILDVLPVDARESTWEHYQRMTKTPCGATFLSREDYNNVSVWVEIISFPFADDEGVARFIMSLSIGIDRKQLDLRGEETMQIGAFSDYRYIDIGCGT